MIFVEKFAEQQRKLITYGRIILFIPLYILNVLIVSEDIWSVRITRNYSAIGILQGDEITLFWIGSHDNYEGFFG